ncbi:MAG: methyl-accepting chemotaxis protein [Treponema sp.]
MTVLTTYALLFFSSSFVGVGLLSWFQKFYLQGQPEKYLKGVPITASVTLCLCVIILIIMAKVLSPLDKIIKRVSCGSEPTEQDRQVFLNTTRTMNKVTMISTVVGFVFGNLITMSIQIAKGAIPFEIPRLIFAIVHSISYGGVATMYTINLMDHFMSEKRKVLKIRSLDKTQVSGTMSSTLAYMFVISLLAVGSTIAMVPYQCIYLKNTEFFGSGLNFYIGNVILVSVISFVCCIVPFALILKGLSKRLKENSSLIHEIASSGNLVGRIDIVVNDDFGIMASSVNELMDKLSSMISGIRTQSQNVADSVGNITDATSSSVAVLTQMKSSFDKINQGGNEQYQIINDVSKDITGLKDGAKSLTDFMVAQSSAMQENSVSITQMAGNIKKVAEMTKKADELITGLAKISERGNGLVSSSINAITEIQKSSVEVQQIIKVIQAISSQTNLLSMNAAIEAAHAGEFGAGFAVVANEVRSLAENSTKSAKDIQAHIKDMVSKISLGVSASQQAGAAFQEIETSVKENQRIMQELTNAMDEQRISAEENMRVTNDVSSALEHANSLAGNQDEFAEHVKTTMDSIVSLTREIMSCINEGMLAVNNMQASVTKVEESVDINRAAVEEMETQVSLFKL